MDKGQSDYPAVPDDYDDEVEDHEEGTLEIDEEGIPQVNCLLSLWKFENILHLISATYFLNRSNKVMKWSY